MEPTSISASHLVSLLQRRYALSPDKVVYTFLLDGEKPLSLTYGQLAQQAQAIAAHLQSTCLPGERAILIYPAGLNFITAFFGCLYAKLIPVPVPVPQRRGTGQRLLGILKDAQPTVVLTEQKVLGQAQSDTQEYPDWAIPFSHLRWCITDTVDTAQQHDWQPPSITPDDLAMLQYTSGSTGQPKGAVMTHCNLLYNQEMLRQAFQIHQDSVMVGWLPHFHDMGLMLMLLPSIYTGIPCVFMAPFAFMRNPLRWLQAISTYKGTIAGAPNFAYELCLRKISSEPKSTLDLSSWSLAVNGAEPIKANTLTRFAEAFADCGFRAESFHPCYGLAEASLFVAGGTINRAPKTLTVEVTGLKQNQLRPASASTTEPTQTLVSCGHTWMAQQIVIVNPETCEPCSPGTIGEIWVQGNNIAQGYWQQPEATRKTFHTQLQGAAPEHVRDAANFLRTGDLGALYDGELFVTGRKKDLIIVAGQNIYPDSIEAIGRSVLGPTAGRLAAFGLLVPDQGTEMPILVCEYRSAKSVSSPSPPNQDLLIQQIRQQVQQELNITLADVRLVRRGWVQLTTSGKVSRTAAREKYLANGWQPEHWASSQHLNAEPKSRTDIEKLLTQTVATATGLSSIDLEKSLHELGIESLLLMQIITRLEQILNCQIPLEQLALQPTLNNLAQLIYQQTQAEKGREQTHHSSVADPAVLTSSVVSTSVDAYQPSVKQPTTSQPKSVLTLQAILKRLPKPGIRSRLSYGTGIQLLRATVSQSLIQQAFYSKEIELLRQCIDSIPIKAPPETIIRQSLMVNKCPLWLSRKLKNQKIFDQWVHIRGAEVLQQLAAQKRGTVIAFPHTPLKSLLRDLPIFRQRELVIVGNLRATSLTAQGMAPMADAMAQGQTLSKTVVRSAQLVAALKTLRAGGIVIVLADDDDGSGGISFPFHGRLRHIRPGAAELALQTNSALVPLFATMAETGEITVDCLQPLTPTGETHTEQVQSLLFQYATLLAQRYQTDLGAMEWFILKKFLALPIVKHAKLRAGKSQTGEMLPGLSKL